MTESSVEEAFKDQGKKDSQYAGVDPWIKGDLKPGDKIAQFEWRSDKVMADKDVAPYSNYFVKVEELEKFRDEKTGKIDAQKFGDSVQVAPRFKDELKKALYNDKLSIYEVKEPIETATSKVQNNIVLGDGGAEQHRIPIKPKALIEEGLIKLVEVKELTNLDHQLKVFKNLEKSIEEKGLKDGAVIETHLNEGVHAAHAKAKQFMLDSGHKNAIDFANKANSLENKAANLRKEAEPNKAVETKVTAPKAPSKSSSIER